MRKNDKNNLTKLHFDEVWQFPEEVEKHIGNIVKKTKGLWLHAPVGKSEIGRGEFEDGIEMITLDINPDVKPDVVADLNHLPFRDNIFDGGISDPLWYVKVECPKCKHALKNQTKGLAYPQRRHLSYSLRRVIKPGGLLLFNGLWNPRVKGFAVKKVEIAVQNFSSFRNVALLWTLKKINSVMTFE